MHATPTSDAALNPSRIMQIGISMADFSKWAGEAGFKRVESIPLMGPASAAVAYK